MDLKYRKFIAKCKPLHRILRYCSYNSGIWFYKSIAKRNKYDDFFSSIKGSKTGKRCFIIGNGASLHAKDLDRLIGEDSFAVNEIHRLFSETQWRPTYYIIMDRYSKSSPEEIRDVECKYCFLGSYYWRYNKVLRKDAICLHQRYYLNANRYKFSTDIGKYVVCAPTVSYVAMQVAAYMGYSEVYLLGFDHSYLFEFDQKGEVVKTGNNSTHFFKDTVQEYIIGDVWGMTKAHEAFRDYAKANNILVRNATRGGKLNVFERVDFEALF